MSFLTAGDQFLAIMSVGYLGAAIAYWLGGQRGLAGALMFYAGANVFLIASAHGW